MVVQDGFLYGIQYNCSTAGSSHKSIDHEKTAPICSMEMKAI